MRLHEEGTTLGRSTDSRFVKRTWRGENTSTLVYFHIPARAGNPDNNHHDPNWSKSKWQSIIRMTDEDDAELPASLLKQMMDEKDVNVETPPRRFIRQGGEETKLWGRRRWSLFWKVWV
jgi:hypothetical protein